MTARSGLLSPEEFREDLALVAAKLDNRPGRTWRPLQDANDEAELLYNARSDWDSWRRDVDFYDEGYLIWLEADVKIRQMTNGTKSLDDFCKIFHGGDNNGPEVKPYMFEDVVAAMNKSRSIRLENIFYDTVAITQPSRAAGRNRKKRLEIGLQGYDE